ncbi:MAG: hypothetical protein R3C14_31470 [Caldilineaceae bacterium]
MSVRKEAWMATMHTLLTTDDAPPLTATLPSDGAESSTVKDWQFYQAVEAVLAGQPPAAVLADVRQQLTKQAALTPVEIEEALLDLQTLIHMFQSDQQAPMIEPVSPPRYNLDFLPKPQPEPVPIPAQVADLWQRGRHWVQDRMGVVWVDFAGQLLGQSPLQPVLVTRSGQKGAAAEEPEIIHQLSIGSEELGDLDLEIKALRTDEPTTCILIVTVRVPSRWPDLEGIQVVVLRSEPMRTGVTDEEGQVVFAEFPVDALERIGFRIDPTG